MRDTTALWQIKNLEAREILEQTRDFLTPEHHWLQAEWVNYRYVRPSFPDPAIAYRSHRTGVAGACSIGAMLLANALEPLQMPVMDGMGFANYARRDPEFTKAVRCVLQVLLRDYNHSGWITKLMLTRGRSPSDLRSPGCVDVPGEAAVDVITTWNDQQSRSHGEVLLVFDQAIKLAIQANETVVP